ncbi:hypothetical protein SAY86_007081 [Trapa natans]|uniref:Uncharacterized protein n=1 Tax=Trapa natans TaxID=22666 RepID=A0AAN7LMM5_TRANT|nr:hypothetical protein SAY86_007081 [Trapa natans]
MGGSAGPTLMSTEVAGVLPATPLLRPIYLTDKMTWLEVSEERSKRLRLSCGKVTGACLGLTRTAGATVAPLGLRALSAAPFNTIQICIIEYDGTNSRYLQSMVQQETGEAILSVCRKIQGDTLGEGSI